MFFTNLRACDRLFPKHPQRLNFRRVGKVAGVLLDGMETLTVERQEMVTTLMVVAWIENDSNPVVNVPNPVVLCEPRSGKIDLGS